MALPARAAGELVVLGQPGVPQYEEVLAGIKSVQPSPRFVPIEDKAALQRALEARPFAILALGTRALALAKEQPRGPLIIATAVLSPETDGRLDVTAVPLETRAADALTALMTLVPTVKRVLALHPVTSTEAVAEARAAAKANGISVDFLPLADLDGFQDFFRRSLVQHDAVWLLPDVRLARPELVKYMVSLCIEKNVALVGFMDGMTKAGGLASVSADFFAIGREAATMATELARKQPVGRIPFRFVSGKVSVSARTRTALGLEGRPVPKGATLLP
jgi:ABC-type uncharacterized transport system substrate-binding protein